MSLHISRWRAPLVATKRPTMPTTPLTGIFDADYRAWLQSQDTRYLSTPIYTDALSVVASTWQQPFVAAESLCQPPTVNGGENNPSPNALIRDRWHGMTLTTTASGTYSDTSIIPLHVNAIGQALPAGFLFNFSGSYIQIMLDAVVGATLLTVRGLGSSVSVGSGAVGVPANGYFYEHGEGAPTLDNLNLLGDPNPPMNTNPRVYELTREYACDGVAIEAMGVRMRDVLVSNFPGHGVWLNQNFATSTFTGYSMPADRYEAMLDGVTAERCLSGITVRPGDCQFGRLAAVACRDYGVRFMDTASNNQVETIHAYGCGKGIWLEAPLVQAGLLEGENCDYGIGIFGSGRVNYLQAYGNTYLGVRVQGSFLSIGSLHVWNSGGTANGSDARPTGYGVEISSYGQLIIDSLMVSGDVPVNGAVRLGIGTSAPLDRTYIKGSIERTTGSCPKGLHVASNLQGVTLDLCIAGGFTKALYFDSSLTVAGSSLKFRGPSGNAIVWPNGATGTFAAPNPPGAITSGNEVTFLTF